MGSRFHASIEGKAKTQATRQGTEKSGIGGHIRGWNVGVQVMGYVDEDGKDRFDVYYTGGSDNPHHNELVLSIHEGLVQDILGGQVPRV